MVETVCGGLDKVARYLWIITFLNASNPNTAASTSPVRTSMMIMRLRRGCLVPERSRVVCVGIGCSGFSMGALGEGGWGAVGIARHRRGRPPPYGSR